MRLSSRGQGWPSTCTAERLGQDCPPTFYPDRAHQGPRSAPPQRRICPPAQVCFVEGPRSKKIEKNISPLYYNQYYYCCCCENIWPPPLLPPPPPPSALLRPAAPTPVGVPFTTRSNRWRKHERTFEPSRASCPPAKMRWRGEVLTLGSRMR